jgi:enhancer of polycomb-like protein
VGGKIAQVHIPTPEAVASKIEYDRFYTRRFTLPETLIRFSSTVEDCIGALYCATVEDEAFIRTLNEKKSDAERCSVDEFEEIIDFFEQTSKTRQPYAALDNAPVLSFDEMARMPEFYEMLSEHARGLAEEVYAYWKARRLRRGNRPLMPALKVRKSLVPMPQNSTKQHTEKGADPQARRRRAKKQMIRIRMCASGAGKSGRLAKLAAETPKVWRN